MILSGPSEYVARVSGKARTPQIESAAPLAAHDRATDRLPPVVRALLDGQDEVVVIFGSRGDILYLNPAAEAALAPASSTPFVDSRRLRAELVARGGRVAPLRFDTKVLGEMIVLPQRHGGTWAEQERDAIRNALRNTGGRRLEAARRLGISRTTLWRHLRRERR